MEGWLAPPAVVTETGRAETLLEVVRQEGVEDRVEGWKYHSYRAEQDVSGSKGALSKAR